VISTQHATGSMIDPARWPDLVAATGSAPRRGVARLLFGAAVARLPIRVRLAGGRQLGAGSADAPLMVIHDPGAFFTRLGAGGLIGFGESYQAGQVGAVRLRRARRRPRADAVPAAAAPGRAQAASC
jgi:cyclopropane-fatty-acyl-phospholipid synthase